MVFAVVLAAIVFAFSCSKDVQNTDNPATDDGGENPGQNSGGDILDGLPDMDFKGESFGIYLPNNPDSVQPAGIYTEGMNGEIFNDAVYNKNAFIEEKYNVKLNVAFGATWDSTASDLKKNVLAGDLPHNVYLSHITKDIAAMTADGLLCKWNDVPYVDFGKPWWNSATTDMLAIDGKIYWTVSSMSMPDTLVLLFNKQMLENYQLEDPYELVRSGKWTIDKLSEMSKSASRDLDGDGKWTKEDQYGLEFGNIYQGTWLMYACGGNTFVMGDDGYPQLNLASPRMVEIYEKMWNLYYEGPPTFLYSEDGGNYPVLGVESGRVLFCQYLLNTCKKLNAYEVDYGILPMPKFDEKQERYLAYIHSSLYGIPAIATKEDLEKTGLLLEAMARLGYRDILPMYHDVVLKIKTVRDDDSSEMLDLIFNNPTDDIANHYDVDQSAPYFIPGKLAAKNRNYTSEVEKVQDGLTQKFRDFYDKVKAIQ